MPPEAGLAERDLFGDAPRDCHIADGAIVLPGFALPADALLDAVAGIVDAAPFRRMTTPGGHVMSVAMTNCGAAGWVSDRRGYRYAPLDPESGRDWPAIPRVFADLARRAASAAGHRGLDPDACLINRYEPGARLALHQDRNERDLSAPIVSVSLGLPATFLFGGSRRNDPQARVPLLHGDVVVWAARRVSRFTAYCR